MMNTPGIPSTRWFDADAAAQGSGLPEGQPEGHVDHRATAAIPSPACRRRRRASRSSICWSWPIRIRPPGRCSPSARTTPICCRSAPVRVLGLAHGVEPLAPMGRADRQADLRVEGRLRDHVPAGQEARLRRQDVQEHQGREQRAGRRGHPARDQPRRLLDRLLRPVAGAPQAAHGEPERLRPGYAAGRRRTIRKSAATTTACRGRAGARRRSSIPAPTSSTTPTCTSRTAAAPSAPASAWSASSRPR